MKVTTFVALVLALLCICFSGLAKGEKEQIPGDFPPGLTTTITQNGLNYAKTVGLQLLAQRLNTIKLPDQKGKKDTVKYEVTNIEFKNIRVPAATLQLQNGAFLASIQQFSGEIEADWKAEETIWPHPGGHGKAKATWGGTTITALMGFNVAAGKPTVAALSTYCHTDKFHVSTTGSGILGVVAEVLVWLFEGTLKKLAEEGVANGIKDAINKDLNQLFQSYPLTVPVYNGLAFNSTLITPGGIYLDSNSLSVNVRGTFIDTADHSDNPPYQPTSIPRIINNANMVQLIFGDWAPDSGSWIASHQGKLNFSLTEPTMAKAPIPFQTNSWKPVAAGLTSKYPNLALTASLGPWPGQPPKASFSPAGISAYLLMGLDVAVVSGAQKINVINFRLNITASATASVANNIVYPRLNYLGVKVDLLNTAVGPVDVNGLNSEMAWISTNIVVPAANNGLANGVKIPMVDRVSLTNTGIQTGAGWLAIVSDMVYHV